MEHGDLWRGFLWALLVFPGQRMRSCGRGSPRSFRTRGPTPAMVAKATCVQVPNLTAAFSLQCISLRQEVTTSRQRTAARPDIHAVKKGRIHGFPNGLNDNSHFPRVGRVIARPRR